jgi:hypothetical protein
MTARSAALISSTRSRAVERRNFTRAAISQSMRRASNLFTISSSRRDAQPIASSADRVTRQSIALSPAMAVILIASRSGR